MYCNAPVTGWRACHRVTSQGLCTDPRTYRIAIELQLSQCDAPLGRRAGQAWRRSPSGRGRWPRSRTGSSGARSSRTGAHTHTHARTRTHTPPLRLATRARAGPSLARRHKHVAMKAKHARGSEETRTSFRLLAVFPWHIFGDETEARAPPCVCVCGARLLVCVCVCVAFAQVPGHDDDPHG